MIGGKGDAESLEGFQVFFSLPRIFALESKVNAAVLFVVFSVYSRFRAKSSTSAAVGYTNKPFVQFYTTKRVGGGVDNPEACVLLKVAA